MSVLGTNDAQLADSMAVGTTTTGLTIRPLNLLIGLEGLALCTAAVRVDRCERLRMANLSGV